MTTDSELSPLHRAILEAWDCAFAGSPIIYLSGPITSGPRFVELLRAGSDIEDARQAAMTDNNAALVAAARELRSARAETVVEPSSLSVGHWSQDEYLDLWVTFIERHARLILFMPGWEYSAGAAEEFGHAVANDLRTETVSGAPISLDDGVALLCAARDDLLAANAGGELTGLAGRIDDVIARLGAMPRPAKVIRTTLRKDESLDFLAERGFNVAQFVSFSPRSGAPHQEYARVIGYGANASFGDARSAIEALFDASPEHSVNVRSFDPSNPESRRFIEGLKSPAEASALVETLAANGLHTIVNETIDKSDGGVSGVLMSNILEFAPDATPRCVESRDSVASLPRGWGRELLATVYRFPVQLSIPLGSRLEFSLHPRPRGWRQGNIIGWEFGDGEHIDDQPMLHWPNDFSRLIGDKTFGLLVAHHIGLPVPRTTVVNRRVAPFSFGRSTGWNESWIRTAPLEQVPGRFTTHRGWIDPFKLMRLEDGQDQEVVSVLAQEGVRPLYSGALIVAADGALILEGKQGEGESLMLGTSLPEDLPVNVETEVRRLFDHASAALGPVRLEWVFDGVRAWVVQLHRGATETGAHHLTKGDADNWVTFDVKQGLEALRAKIRGLPEGSGLALKGRVGLTSHFADVIRKAKIPARIDA